MSNFIAEASNELEHVVWPTPTENKKYMMYTIGVIVILGIFLAVLGYAVTNSLAFVRGQFPHDTVTAPTVSGEDTMTQAELDKLIKTIPTKTGATSHGKTATGATIKTATGSSTKTATGSR